MWSAMHCSMTIAALLSVVAFLSLLTVFPVIINEIAKMEEELSIHRGQFTVMSNAMWNDLMTQSAVIRHARAIRHNAKPVHRVRRQYDSEGYGGSSVEGDSERGYDDDKVAGGSEGKGHNKVNKCPAGPKGPPGDNGMKGEDGMDGMEGKNGLAGEAVPYTSGPCAPCPQGPAGFPGYKGRRGPRGHHGKKGPIGPGGRDGEPGLEGSDGDAGPMGETGLDGENGEPGKDGFKYKKTGKGPKGETGPVGPEGDEGPPGQRGNGGQPGDAGEAGPAGPNGKPGRLGPRGHQGKPGTSGGDGEYCPCPDRSNGEPGQKKEDTKGSERPLNAPVHPAHRPGRGKGSKQSYERPGIRPVTVHPPTESEENDKPEGNARYSPDESAEPSEPKDANEEGKDGKDGDSHQVSGSVKPLGGKHGKPRKTAKGRKEEIRATTASSYEEESAGDTNKVVEKEIPSQTESVDETASPAKSSAELEKDYSEEKVDKPTGKSTGKGYDGDSNDIKPEDNAKPGDNAKTGDNQQISKEIKEDDEELPAPRPYDKRAAAARLRRRHRTL